MATSSLTVSHALGEVVSVSIGGVEIFTLDYVSAPKPFLHPIRTLSGHVLTNFQPSDHHWHRGMWFAIKYVNGENFWEEDPTATPNVQRAVQPPTLTPTSDGGIHIAIDLEWTRHDGQVLMDEQRQVIFRPRDDSSYLLDHLTTLTPREDVLLDRTPFTTWGGYGGLCFRGTRNWTDSMIRLSDGTETARPQGIPADWALLTGRLDGDRDLTASVAILDHPSNDRSPTPWYGANGLGLYLTPAPLFHEPLSVAKGASITFNYRVIVAERALSDDEIHEAHHAFQR